MPETEVSEDGVSVRSDQGSTADQANGSTKDIEGQYEMNVCVEVCSVVAPGTRKLYSFDLQKKV